MSRIQVTNLAKTISRRKIEERQEEEEHFLNEMERSSEENQGSHQTWENQTLQMNQASIP